MKNISDLRVIQIRLFPPDVLPLSSLLLEKNLSRFKEKLRFKATSLGENKKEILGLLFYSGEFEHEGKAHLIEHLQIEQQKIAIAVVGSSAVADLAYGEVRSMLVAMESNGGTFRRAREFVKTEETVCMATLDVDFKSFFNPWVLEFLGTVQKHTSTEISSSEVVPVNFSAKLSYEILDRNLKKKFNLVDKKLTIEPRAGTNPDERRYFTKSPTDSETHLSLLRELERAVRRNEGVSSARQKKKR